MKKLMVGLIFLVLFVSTAANAEDKFELAGRLAWTFTATDIVSTEIAISRGALEGNPLLKNRAVRIAWKVGTVAVANHVTKKMKNRKLATIVRWSVVGVMAFATGNNIVVASF